MSYEPPFASTPHIESLCIDIAEMVGSLTPSAALSSSPTLHHKLRISTIRSSLVIEGNSLSEEMVTAVMDGKRVLGPTQDIREVENAQRAYGLLPELDPYSINDLLRAHGTMMEGLVSHPGSFRNGNVGVYAGNTLVHAGTPARYVPQVMGDLFDWMGKTDFHPLVMSCVFHYEFEFIHPFSDGNGRTGRLWHTLILSCWRPVLAWLPIESVILERQNDYYAALAVSNAEGTCTPFVDFMLEVIRDALRPYAHQSGEQPKRTSRTLEFLASHPLATIAELAEYLGCSRSTAQRTINELKTSGALVRKGSARSGSWVVVHAR